MKASVDKTPARREAGVGDVVIVGAGQAGHQAAASLRQAGHAGRIMLIGDDAALPYQRPPLSKAYLKSGGSDADLRLGAETFYECHRIGLLCAQKVSALDRPARRILQAAESAG